MKIALIGYGKMGKAIEEIALQNGHEIVLKISIENAVDLTIDNIQKADVAIEFTGPESAVKNIRICLDAGIPVVCGSTGWLKDWETLVDICNDKNGALLYASNFSIGVNIFFEINKQLAKLMSNRPEYNVSIEETHHTEKKDAPSGTAISIAEDLLANYPLKNKWILGKSSNQDELSIISKRIDPAPGVHSVLYNSPIDQIEIIHTAHNRIGFASGAVLAAEFILGKKGVFNMGDVLASSINLKSRI